MARYVPKITNVDPFYNGPAPGSTTETVVGITQKALRLKILADRFTRGFQQAEVSGPPNAYENSGLPLFATEKANREARLREAKANRVQIDTAQSQYTFEPANQRKPTDPLADTISIVDIDYKDSQKNTRGYSYLTLPFVPRELSYEASSKFIGIATMGRNNPYYQFTGSEDTLQFDIDWFAQTDNRQDVINSCRWVEALTKSNGYIENPHRVKLVWGQDDLLWSDYIWVVVAAPYTLSEFVKGQRNVTTREVERLGLMPQQAIQKITLKRTTDHNLMTSEILGKLSNIVDYGK